MKLVSYITYLLIICIFVNMYFFSLKSKSFNLEEISIHGCSKTNPLEIIKNLEIFKKKNIFSLNLLEIKNLVEQFALVDNVIIHRKIPGTLDVKIIESKPIALLNINEDYYSFTLNTMKKITKLDIEKYSIFKDLTYVECTDSSILLESIKQLLTYQVEDLTSVYCIGDRRLDIILEKKIRIMLPENLDSLPLIFSRINLVRQQEILKKNSIYAIIDARVEKKFFIQNIQA